MAERGLKSAGDVPAPEPVPPMDDPGAPPPPPPPSPVPPDEDGDMPPPVRLPGRPGVPERVAVAPWA